MAVLLSFFSLLLLLESQKFFKQMKKDIEIPKIEGVYMAMVYEHNELHNTMDWNAYLVNESALDLSMILITSSGWEAGQQTSEIRRKANELPSNSYVKVEYVLDTVLDQMNNQFFITFFGGNKMYEQKYVFLKGSVSQDTIADIPILNKKGFIQQAE